MALVGVARVFSEGFDVVVAGAGYAGLASAVRLLEEGLGVVVIERLPGIVPPAYYGGVGGRVVVDKTVLSRLGVEASSYNGGWADPGEILVSLARRLYSLGGRLLLGYSVEPVFREEYGETRLAGVAVRRPGDSGDAVLDQAYISSRLLVDASGPAAEPSISVIESLKPGVVPQGPGPTIPGSREVVEKTGWVIEGAVVAAGLAAASVFGSALPFPDITPLLESGEKAAEHVLTVIRVK